MRSIQDSEDEDEELSPVKPRHQAAIPSPEVANSLDRSTDSTDTQLRKAHLALIEPTPASNMVVSESPTETRKRRNTLTETPASNKKVKVAKTSCSQSTQASAQSFNSAGVQEAIHHAYVLQPTGDTERMGTTEQEQAVKEALVRKTLHLEAEPQSMTTGPAGNEQANESSPMPWSAGPSEVRTQSTEQAAQVPRSTEPNSDDFIGLPKEQYQARASRSRSTQIADANIEGSIGLEKVAKKKRTRTADCLLNPSSSSAEPFPIPSSELHRTQKTSPRDTETSSIARVAGDTIKIALPQSDKSKPDQSHSSEIAETPQSEVAAREQLDSASQASHHSLVEVRIPARSSKTTIPSKVLSNMPTPSMPPPTIPASSSVDAPSKRGRKPKRSHTTIFEDHVGLESVQPSPNLKQQQAARKTDATSKRGRGRPKKADAEQPQQAASLVEETPPNPSPDELALPSGPQTPQAGTQTREFQPPATPEASPLSPVTTTTHVSPGKENDSTPTASITFSAPSLKKTVVTSSEPHSPIKQGKNVFRVGLSKRQRIKPLLKIIGR